MWTLSLWGRCTTLGLAATSGHPELAGVQEPLLQLLLDRGAQIEKPNLAAMATAQLLRALPMDVQRQRHFWLPVAQGISEDASISSSEEYKQSAGRRASRCTRWAACKFIRRNKKKVTASDIGSTLLVEITGTPLSAPALATYTTPGASLPLAVYYGTTYDKNPNLTVSYSPAQLQSHYGLTPLIKKGYDGTGQTIALVEAFGYAAAETDANAAAKVFGLPALTSSNFSVIYPEGKPINAGAADLTGWTTEIALDIQSSHAIAPGRRSL